MQNSHGIVAVHFEKLCFIPETIFRSATSLQFVQAHRLAVGERILDRVGKPVEIQWACVHPCRSVQLVELITATASLTVTASHRIVVLSAHAEVEVEAYAAELKVGDTVMVGLKPASLEDIKQSVRETAVIELGFENDALVEAWPLPLEGGVVTKGQAAAHVYDGSLECKEEEISCETTMPTEGTPSGGRRSRRSRNRYDTAWRALRQRTPSPE